MNLIVLPYIYKVMNVWISSVNHFLQNMKSGNCMEISTYSFSKSTKNCLTSRERNILLTCQLFQIITWPLYTPSRRKARCIVVVCYLISTVKKSKNISFLHRNFSGWCLSIVIQCHYLLCGQIIYYWGLLLLQWYNKYIVIPCYKHLI